MGGEGAGLPIGATNSTSSGVLREHLLRLALRLLYGGHAVSIRLDCKRKG